MPLQSPASRSGRGEDTPMRTIAGIALLAAAMVGPAGAYTAPTQLDSYTLFGAISAKLGRDVVVQNGGVGTNETLKVGSGADVFSFAAADRLILGLGNFHANVFANRI